MARKKSDEQDGTIQGDQPEGQEPRKLNKSDLPKIIYFDDAENDVERKEFTREHAIKLVALQHARGYTNWTISKGQNLDVKDGKIVGGEPSGNVGE